MGKGDKKSKKGKIAKGTFGARRRRKVKADHNVAMEPPKETKKPAKKTATKAKKPAAKKKAEDKEEKK